MLKGRWCNVCKLVTPLAVVYQQSTTHYCTGKMQILFRGMESAGCSMLAAHPESLRVVQGKMFRARDPRTPLCNPMRADKGKGTQAGGEDWTKGP